MRRKTFQVGYDELKTSGESALLNRIVHDMKPSLSVMLNSMKEGGKVFVQLSVTEEGEEDMHPDDALMVDEKEFEEELDVEENLEDPFNEVDKK